MQGTARSVTQAACACLMLLQCTRAAFYHKDFSSLRGWRLHGDARHHNKTIELISERTTFPMKTWNICSVWSKRKVYWQEGFEMKLVFRSRVPDGTNNGGEGFALVFQQNRANAMGDLDLKGGRPNGQTYTPAGLGLDTLSKSWAMKFDANPETTDASQKMHVSIHEGGDWINPHPGAAFTDKVPEFNNGHDHTVKIYYDIEQSHDGPVGMLRVFWTSDYQGHPSWGTLDTPVLQTKVHFDTLDQEPAWIGLTSTSSETKAQTVEILAWTYHEIRSINAQDQKCVVCGGINPRCCLHWERMKHERDGAKTDSFILDKGQYIGQHPTPTPGSSTLTHTPRLWQYGVWDVPVFKTEGGP